MLRTSSGEEEME